MTWDRGTVVSTHALPSAQEAGRMSALEETGAELAGLLAAPSRALLDLEDGLHAEFPADDYHARIPGVASKGALDEIARSPARYKAWLDGKVREETPALSLGKAIHMALLEPDRFARTYLIAPDFGPCRKTADCSSERAKDNKTRRDAWRAEHAGAVLLDSRDGATTLGMVRAVVEHPTASALLLDGIAEATLKWRDPETGLVCKGRPDYYLPDIATCLDIKSTVDAREDSFSRSIFNYGYHRQEAHYSDGFREVKLPLEDYLLLAIEKEPPFDLSIWQLDDDARAVGREQVRAAMLKMAHFHALNEWPGYPIGIHPISLPAWARKRT